MADSTVPVNILPCTFIQEPIYLARRNSKFSRMSRSLKIIYILVSLVTSQGFISSLLSSLTAWSLLEVENSLSPIMYLTNYILVRCKLRNVSLAGVTGFWGPGTALLNSIVLKVPMMYRRYFYFPKKRRCKKFSWRSFSTAMNAYPVFFVANCKKIHSNCTACITGA